MSWFPKRTTKPDGMYNASSSGYACVNCAYHEKGICHLHRKFIETPSKLKCGDFLREDHSIPDTCLP